MKPDRTQPITDAPADRQSLRPGTGLRPHALLTAPRLTGLLPGLRGWFSTELPRVADDRLAGLLQGLVAEREGQERGALPLPFLLAQTHSERILDLTATCGDGAAAGAADRMDNHPRSGQRRPTCDGLATRLESGGLLAVKTADCVPVLAADPEIGAYAALHAGWRGAASGILANLLGMWRAAGSSLGEVVIVLGPHIRGCCYEVGADCLSRFQPEHLEGAVSRDAGSTHLDLAAVLRGQALEGGVTVDRIETSPHCTCCLADAQGEHPYASYRRSLKTNGGAPGTNAGLIAALPAC